ncbi:hypothetical protein [Metabacillus lacus]|uniref:hypothetical protein n=1 Tax=Metabacillus lacus TaxID=1983721 RepID=UPI0014784116|nr:hypothetical protein [Metabacillus lacus]
MAYQPTNVFSRLNQPSHVRHVGYRLAYNEGVILVAKRKDLSQIERELGISEVRPLNVSANDQRENDRIDDYFSSWYEEELQEIYES